MMGLSIMMPAMLHMMCSPPWRAAMFCTSASAAPLAATLSSALSARPPWPRMAAAVSDAVALLMSAQTTVAPAPASTSAVERPMPLPAPVTRATRPVRSNALRTVWAVSIGAPYAVTPSSASSARLHDSPPPYPPMPLLASTRWQGTMMAMGLRPLAWPTARGPLGRPTRRASSP